MPTLHLGVVDQPYNMARKKGQKRVASNITTGDVAGFLEENYHVMQTFANVHLADIADDLAKSMAGAMENLMLGAPIAMSPYARAESMIRQRFNDFIDNKEMDRLGIPGVPTQASLEGVNHRKKSGRNKPKGKTAKARAESVIRPSFLDTGLYESSMRVWVE
jgi:hypothetical protein